MSHDEPTNIQHIAYMEEAARKMRREADEAEAQLLLTPTDGYLNQWRIALGELADKVQEAAQRLREGVKSDDK